MRDHLVTAVALAMMVTAILAMDPRARAYVTDIGRDALTPTGVTAVGTQVGEVGSAVLDAATDRTIAHAPLLLFGCAAALLVYSLLRT